MIKKIIDDYFQMPDFTYKQWDSMSIEEKIGTLAVKLDEVIDYIQKENLKKLL